MKTFLPWTDFSFYKILTGVPKFWGSLSYNIFITPSSFDFENLRNVIISESRGCLLADPRSGPQLSQLQPPRSITLYEDYKNLAPAKWTLETWKAHIISSLVWGFRFFILLLFHSYSFDTENSEILRPARHKSIKNLYPLFQPNHKPRDKIQSLLVLVDISSSGCPTTRCNWGT